MQEGAAMRRPSGADYSHVQGLMRGLAVLRALNSMEGGWATANELSERTDLHRTTVRRLVETLIAEGYVRRSESDDSFRLSLKVRELSEGFTDDEWIAQVAAPVLGELLEKTVWPSDLTTLDGDAMIIRETTHRFSPLSFHRSMVRRRMPLLYTASGKAYLAFCPDEERQQLLRLLIANHDEQSALARQGPLVERMMNKIRSDGYASNDGEWKQEAKIAAIALPVRRDGRVLACVNVVYLRRAMTIEEAAKRYLPALRAAIAKIEGGLAKSDR
jgi:IclR family mhp operon transcriptional activator